MTINKLTDERLAKILSETQEAITEHNSRCVRGCVEVDARLFESVLAELQEYRKAAKVEKWCPDVDPITRYPLFMWIEHPELGSVPTYGGPYDSYTLTERDENGEFFRHRFDHDRGSWVEDEYVCVNVVEDWLPKDQAELDEYVRDNPPVELQEYRKAEPVAWRFRTTDIKGNHNPDWSFSEEASLLGLYQPLYASPQPLTDAERAELQEYRKAPAVPDCCVLVPVEPTEDMIIAGFESEPAESFSEQAVWETYQAMSGCQQAVHRVKLCWAAMITVAPRAPCVPFAPELEEYRNAITAQSLVDHCKFPSKECDVLRNTAGSSHEPSDR